MTEGGLVTVQEMATILSVPVSWLYQRTRLGPKAIPHLKLGKYVRFNPERLRNFLKGRKMTKQKQIAQWSKSGNF